MAFPSIPTSAGGRILSVASTAGGSTNTFPSLTGLTKNAGDLLIAIIVIYDGNSTNAEFSSWGASFNEFVDQATTTTMGIGAAYKFSTGSETGTFTVTSSDSSTNDRQMILLSIAGAHASTPPEGSTIANGTSSNATPSSLNPAGWGTEDTLWIEVIGWGEVSTTGSATGVSGVSSNYGSTYTAVLSADAAGGVEVGIGFRQLNAASEQPDTAFSVDTSNARHSVVTLAVRPAEVASTPGSVSPSAIARSFTVNAVTAKGAAKTTPSAVTRSFTVDAATAKGTAKTTPAVTARSFTLGAVTAFDSGAPGSVAPAATTAVLTIGAPTVSGAAKTTPAVTSLSVALPALTVKGTAKTTPAVLDLDFVLHQVNAFDSGSLATVTPAAISRAVTLPAPTVKGAAEAEPAAIARSFTVDAVTVKGAGKVTPAVTAQSFQVHQASVTLAASPSPATIARTFTIPGVTVRGAAGTTPGTIVITVTVPDVSVLIPAEYTYQEGGLTVIVQQGGNQSDSSQGATTGSNVSGGIAVGRQE